MGTEQGQLPEENGIVLDSGGRHPNAESSGGLERVRLWLSGAGYADTLRQLESQVEQEISDLLASPTMDKKEVLSRLRERRRGLSIKPEFTPEVVGVCKQILAFGAAGIGLTVALAPRLSEIAQPWLSALMWISLAYVDLMIASLAVLALFFLQARSRYPFLYLERLGNTIPAFYYETLSREWNWSPVNSRRSLLAANRKYLDDLRRFVGYVVHEDLTGELRAEVQQYYLLVVYQGYLDQYELQLVNLFTYLVVGGFLSIAFLAFFF